MRGKNSASDDVVFTPLKPGPKRLVLGGTNSLLECGQAARSGRRWNIAGKRAERNGDKR